MDWWGNDGGFIWPITVHRERPNAQGTDAPRAHLPRLHNFCLFSLRHHFPSPSNSLGSTTRLPHKPPHSRRIENHFKRWEDMPADLYFLFLSFFFKPLLFPLFRNRTRIASRADLRICALLYYTKWICTKHQRARTKKKKNDWERT